MKTNIVYKSILLVLSMLIGNSFAQSTQQADSQEVAKLSQYFQEQDKVVASKIDFTSFMKLAEEVEQYRANRLLGLDDFLAKAKQPNTIILDSRSKAMYDRKHLKGAIHLNYSDYNQISLYQLIPDKNTTILIYCNNNFIDDQQNFASKMAVIPKDLDGKQTYANNLTLALNIPTFINLYGYGYRNVYELADLVSVNNKRIQFAGTAVIENIK